MEIKRGALTKKINNVINIIYPKSHSDMIVHEDSTVEAALQSIADDLQTLAGQTSTIDSRISTACTNLYNQIMGYTDSEAINTAFDTLKEIAEYLDANSDASFTSSVVNNINSLNARSTAIENTLGSDDIANYSNAKGIVDRVTDSELEITNIKSNANNLLEDIQENSSAIKLLERGLQYDYKFYSNCYTWTVGKLITVVDNRISVIDSGCDDSAYLVIEAKKNEHYLIKGICSVDIPLIVLEEEDEDHNKKAYKIGFDPTDQEQNLDGNGNIQFSVENYTHDDIVSGCVPIDGFEGKIYINALYATKSIESTAFKDITITDNNDETHTISVPLPIGTPVIGIATDIKKANTCFVTFIGDSYCFGENWGLSHYTYLPNNSNDPNNPDPQRRDNNLKDEAIVYYGIDEDEVLQEGEEHTKIPLTENNWEIETIGESILNCIPDPYECRLIGAIGGSEWQNNEEFMDQYPGITTHGAAYGMPLAFAESNRNAYVLTTYEYLIINIYNSHEESLLDYDLKYTLYKSKNDNINNYYILSFMFNEFANGNTLGDVNNITWLPKIYNDISQIEDKYVSYVEYTGDTQTEVIDNDNFINRLQMTITKILHDIPGVKVGFITPLKLYNEDYIEIKNRNNETLEQWVNAAKTVCNYFSIPILDLYHDGPHTFYQAKYENYYTGTTFKDANGNLVCYPNQSTYRMINDRIEKFIFSL